MMLSINRDKAGFEPIRNRRPEWCMCRHRIESHLLRNTRRMRPSMYFERTLYTASS